MNYLRKALALKAKADAFVDHISMDILCFGGVLVLVGTPFFVACL